MSLRNKSRKIISIAYMNQGLRGGDLNWKIQELIEKRKKAGGFEFWVRCGQPSSKRTKNLKARDED
jgi:hypothetical protein